MYQRTQKMLNSKQPQRQHLLGYSLPQRLHFLVSSQNLLITLTSPISRHLQYSPSLSGTSSLHLKGESYMCELHMPMVKDGLCSLPRRPSRPCHVRSRKQQLSTNLPVFAFPRHEGLEPTSQSRTLINPASS